MVMFTFSIFNQKYPFLVKFGQKIQNHQFGIIFFFGIPFLGTFGPKIKIVCLKYIYIYIYIYVYI